VLLVTGGLGFIGSNFVRLALSGALPEVLGKKIVVLDALTYAGSVDKLGEYVSHPNLKVVIGDICDLEIVNSIVRESEGVIHFAAESHVDQSIFSPDTFISTNVFGTYNLVKACEEFGKQITIVSTDEVYGSLETGQPDENAALNPSSPYSASKASSDLIALSFYKTFGTRVNITRCTNNYGIHQNDEKLIPTVISNLAKDDHIPIYGDGLYRRNWIHVDDHCDGISKAYGSQLYGQVFNFGTTDELSNLELLAKIGQALSIEPKIKFVDDRKGHDRRYAVSFQKAERILGWKAKNSFAESIPVIARWYYEKYTRATL
jgi:dTDP-glucose 4,6-dehydratase